MTKKGKRLIAVLVCSVFLFLLAVVIHTVVFKTYWKYPDLIIQNMSREQICNKYGAFDFESTECAGYYIYTDKLGARHYYIMYFTDCSGNPHRIVDDTAAVLNEISYYMGKEPPEYIGIEKMLKQYNVRVIQCSRDMNLQGTCEYLGITEEEFLQAYKERYIDIVKPEDISFSGDEYTVNYEVQSATNDSYYIRCEINADGMNPNWAMLMETPDEINSDGRNR